MKKILVFMLCAVMAFAFVGCGESGGGNPGTTPATGYNPNGNTAENTGTPPVSAEDSAVNDKVLAMMSVEQLLSVTPQKDLSVSSLDIEKFTTPFYDTQIQYCEGFFLLENEEGTTDPVTLAFPAKKVLEVRSNDLSVLYTEGKDYVLNDDGTLSIPAGSAITPLSRDEFYVSSGQWSDDNGPVVNTTATMYKGHYTVTYIRTDGYEGITANGRGDKLQTFAKKANAGEALNVLVLGDSIAAGAGVKDFPKWADLTEQGIEYYTDSEVTLTNAAVPGIHSAEYVGLIDKNMHAVDDNIEEDAKAKFALAEAAKDTADLAIIAIGANDAGGWCGATGTPVANYTANVQRMIEYVRDASPDCSILLVSCMQTNPKIKDTANGNKLAAANLSEYETALSGIAAGDANILLANVHGVESSLRARKNIEDFLGDNINHPSDYMSRIYTQVVLSALLDL